mmetsp:Transcript_35484/g.80066  ORF Transcript_35484/g.80066 Transcript_35484/m.80066 type:complete len:127 (-) Transcript_35484:94-474(-)|eukprot:748976-Hanusia_phi.AAC.1
MRRLTDWMNFLCVSSLRMCATSCQPVSAPGPPPAHPRMPCWEQTCEKIFSRADLSWIPTIVTPIGQAYMNISRTDTTALRSYRLADGEQEILVRCLGVFAPSAPFDDLAEAILCKDQHMSNHAPKN